MFQIKVNTIALYIKKNMFEALFCIYFYRDDWRKKLTKSKVAIYICIQIVVFMSHDNFVTMIKVLFKLYKNPTNIPTCVAYTFVYKLPISYTRMKKELKRYNKESQFDCFYFLFQEQFNNFPYEIKSDTGNQLLERVRFVFCLFNVQWQTFHSILGIENQYFNNK